MTTRVTGAIAILCLIYPAVAGPVHASQHAMATRPSPGPWTTRTAPAAPDVAGGAGVAAALAELPMAFEQNVGQSDERVTFLTRGSGYTLFLTQEEAVFALPHATEPERTPDEPGPRGELSHLERTAGVEVETSVLRMRLVGATASTPVGEQELAARTNYFLGDDPSLWYTDVVNFGRVRYADVYPGVDLVYYGNRGVLEYDFVVAPGADPSAIEVEWEGAETVEVDESGRLVMKLAGGELRQAAPVLYQQNESGRTTVAGRFEPAGGGRVRVVVGAYDAARPLVIDPTLTYSTYLGGSGSEQASDVAVDASGAAYVTGTTQSSTFPTLNGYDASLSGITEVYVAKLHPAGNALVYSTYLGGSDVDYGYSIAVDATGAAYVSGSTRSTDFPMFNAYDASYNGNSNDAVVAKLSPAGNALVYSTHLGGSGVEIGYAVAVSGTTAYVAGGTSSADFPVTDGAFDQSYGNGHDAWIACLTHSSGNVALLYCTFLGGSSTEGAADIAVRDGQVYVAGHTYSTDFPTANAYDASHNGSVDVVLDSDAFVAKLSRTGNALVYATYLGGSDNIDQATSIAVDSAGSAYVTGRTYSDDFPTANAYDTSRAWGGCDAFVTKLSPAGDTLVYSTYLGGSDLDVPHGIAVDPFGAAYVTGQTQSADFPTVKAYDMSYDGEITDAFVTKLAPSGNVLDYSTYLGGSNIESGIAVAVDAVGSAYVTGVVSSTDFPTANAYDPSYNGGPVGGAGDSFVAKLTTAADLRATMVASPNPYQPFQNLTLRVTVRNLGPAVATDVRVSVPTPAQTTLVSVTTSQGSQDGYLPPGSTGTVKVDVGAMEPDVTVTVTVVVKLNKFANGSVVATASVSSGAYDPNPANNTVTRTVPRA